MSAHERRAWARALLVFVVVIVFDQITKAIVRSTIAPGSARHILPGLKLVHDANQGIAFSLSAGGQGFVVILITVAVIAIGVYFALHANRRLFWLPTGLLLGGAVGNLIDRVRLGAVTDFIKFPYWPAFNCADMSITFGVLILLLLLGRDGNRSSS